MDRTRKTYYALSHIANVCFTMGSEKMAVAHVVKRDELVITTLERDVKLSIDLRSIRFALLEVRTREQRQI